MRAVQVIFPPGRDDPDVAWIILPDGFDITAAAEGFVISDLPYDKNTIGIDLIIEKSN